jgi:hypothetical protein
MRAALVAVVFLAGCMSQEEKDDITNICFAAEKAGAADTKDPSEKAIKSANFLRENVKTEKWKAWLKNAAGKSPAKRTLDLQSAAKDAGLKSCPIADAQ